MSNVKMPTVTEKTVFQYNALGQVSRISSDDGDTYQCYYSAPASNTGDAGNKCTPDTGTVLEGFKMADGKKLSEVLQLTCPTVSDTNQPPLLGLLKLDRSPDGGMVYAKMTLFGYHLATLDSRGVLIPNTVLTVENIAADPTHSPWIISKAKGTEGVRVTLQQNSRTTDGSASSQTITNWFKDDSTRITHTLNETSTRDPATHTHLTRTTAAPDGKSAHAPVLSQQVRSTLSGALLCQSSQDEDGHPVSETHFLYDVRGRSTGTYLLGYDEATFCKGADRDTRGLGIRREESGQGTWVTVVGPDGRCGRTLYDGLQRPVRHELQRHAGGDHSAHNYCLIHEVKYDAFGKLLEQNLYDYLPGGLRRRQRNQQLPAKLNDWFWQAGSSSSSVDATGSRTQVNEHTLGNLRNNLTATVRQTLTSYGDGRLEQQRQRWAGKEADKNNRAIAQTTKYDAQGRVVEVTEIAAHAADGSAKTTRIWSTEYDALNRRTKQHCPGKKTIEYDYEGYATSPVRITVRQGTQTRVLGSRTLEGNGLKGEQILTMTRGDGAKESALVYGYQNRAVEFPDKSRIISRPGSDGQSIDYFIERTDSQGNNPSSTLLVSFTQSSIARAISRERHAEGEHQAENVELTSSANLLGSYRIQQHARNVSYRHSVQGSLRGEVEQVRNANGVLSRIWRDANGHVRRVRRNNVEYLYGYNAAGELEHTRVKGTSAAHDLEVSSTYDALGFESSREYRLAGKPLVRYERTWSAAGQLLSKRLYRDGASSPASQQDYTYDPTHGWLLEWSIKSQEGDHAQDHNGNALKSQSYQYDLLANLTQCRSERADGTVEIRDYSYHKDYSTRREQVTVTVQDRAGKQTARTTIQLQYDGNGNLTVNERGQQLGYTPTGRLASVSDTTGLLTTYEYDANDRLIGQWNNVLKQRQLLAYSGDRLCMETWQDTQGTIIKRRILDEEAGLVVQVLDSSDSGTNTRTLFNLLDPHDGGGDQYHQNESGEWVRASITFTPWGEAATLQLGMLEGFGFNGQRVDPVSGCYHLGNGYRSYDPVGKAFQQPDDWSPFGLGGLNDRAYCSGDPVNWHDPSGHFMVSRQAAASHLASLDEMIRDTAPPVHERAAWWEWVVLGVCVVVGVVAALMTGGAAAVLLLGLLVIATALDIASMATRHTNPRLSKKLGYAALAVGLVDVAYGVGKAGLKGMSWLTRQAKKLKEAVKFSSITQALRRSGRYITHFDDLTEIGSSASKARSAGAVSKLDNALDLSDDIGHYHGLADNSLGITTWGGKQKYFTPLHANSRNAGGVYALVDHAHVDETLARNAVEIKNMGESAKNFATASKKFSNSAELTSHASTMEKRAAQMKKTSKRTAEEYLKLKALNQQHQKAFDQVTTLKGAHEELLGLRTNHNEFFVENTTRQHFGRVKSTLSSRADDVEITSMARPSSHADFHDELMNALDSTDQEVLLSSEVAWANKHLESLPITDLDKVSYRIIDPLTGEKKSEADLLDRYFRTTLNQEDAILLQRQKTERLGILAKITGDEKGFKNFLAIANSQTDPAKRRQAFQAMHMELSNACAARHKTAVEHLQAVNKRVGQQAAVVHDLLDEQANAYNDFVAGKNAWFVNVTESGSKGIDSVLLAKLTSIDTTMTPPTLRLRVFGHLEDSGIPKVAASRYRLRVDSVAEHLTSRETEVRKLMADGDFNRTERVTVRTTEGKAGFEFWSPEMLQEKLTEKGLNPEFFHEVDLVMCNSATGGESSFASKFSMLSNRRVRGFEGNVTSTGYVEAASKWSLVPDSRNPERMISEVTEHMGPIDNAGRFPKVESYYEQGLSTHEATVDRYSRAYAEYHAAKVTHIDHKIANMPPNIVNSLLGKVTQRRRELLSVSTQLEADFLRAGREAGEKTAGIYLTVLKSNNRYNNYKPQYFSPLLHRLGQ